MERKRTFKGGVHPLPGMRHGKAQTEGLSVELMPPPKTVSLPCTMHLGAPSKPIVAVGDYVKMGQKIAEPGGFLSVPVHASVSGKVIGIVQKQDKTARFVTNIVIENDFTDTLSEDVQPKGALEDIEPDAINKLILEAGIVGLGGAGFPTHVKLSIPQGKSVDGVIINGAECEPFLTADHRLMLEHPEKVIFGLQAVMRCVGCTKGYVGIEDNKPDAIEALRKANNDSRIEICVMQTKYPQGSEKQLIDTIMGRQVPPGKLPLDVGAVVVNAASAAAISDAIKTGMPVVQRITTVTGNFVNPKNLLCRLGTPLEEVVEYCGGFSKESVKLIAGGPMMGLSMDSVCDVVTKTTSGLLALSDEHIKEHTVCNCIRCGRCASVCPIHLLPMMISQAAEKDDFENAEKYGAMECIGCSCCSYICPSNRHIAQSIRIAKDFIGAKRRKEAAAKKAAEQKGGK